MSSLLNLPLKATVVVTALAASLAIGPPSVLAQDGAGPGDSASRTTNSFVEGSWQGGRQDPAFVQAKQEFRVHLDASGEPHVYSEPQKLDSAFIGYSATPQLTTVLPDGTQLATIALASHVELSTGYVDNVVEPKGDSSHDDNGTAYFDGYYYNFCGPGAASVTIYFTKIN